MPKQPDCRKAITFRSRVSAKLALARLRAKDDPRRDKSQKREYYCHVHHGWHLTSKEKR